MCIQRWLLGMALLIGLLGCGSNLYQRAKIYEDRGDYRSAIDAYEAVVRTSSSEKRAAAQTALGRIYVNLGRYWEAKDYLEQARKAIPSGDPDYAEVAYYLGYCYYEIGDQWANNAIEAFEQAVTRMPRAHLYLSVLYYEYGQYQAALRHTERVQGEDEARAKYISGLIYRELGGLDNYQKAMLALQRAVEVEKDLDTKRQYQQMLEQVDREIQETMARGKKIEVEELQPVFAAIYRYYEQTPIGKVTVTNPTGEALRDVTLTLDISGYLDQPETYTLPPLAPKDRVEVDLTVHFSSKILEVTQDLDAVPVNLQLIYATKEGPRIEQASVQHIRIHGVNALNWKPLASIAAFVTHRNEAISAFSRHASILGNPLEKAIQIYEALNLYGIQYELDPQDPYGEGIDYVFYPYQTLQHRKGDCDDLSVLYAACLQNIGIDTRLILTPTHIYLMFNSGMSTARAKRVIPDANLYIAQEQMAWIPVEVTMLGKRDSNFLKAWIKGAEEFRSDYPIVSVPDAWATFPPMTQGAAVETLQAELPDKATILKSYNRVVADAEAHWQGVFRQDIEYLQKQLADGTSDKADLQNKIALRHAWLGEFDQAEVLLRDAISSAPSIVRYHANLGNVLFLKADRTGDGKAFDAALAEYQNAIKVGGTNTMPVRLNLAIYYLAKQESELAQKELAQIEQDASDGMASNQVVALARELGIPITVSPRAGDLPDLVKDKIGEAASVYTDNQKREQYIGQLVQQLTEDTSPEDLDQIRNQLQQLSLPQLEKLVEKSASAATARDLVLKEAPTEESTATEASSEEPHVTETPPEEPSTMELTSEEPGVAETPPAEPDSIKISPTAAEEGGIRISKDQIENLIAETFEIEGSGTRASGISEPEGLQWWLAWME